MLSHFLRIFIWY